MKQSILAALLATLAALSVTAPPCGAQASGVSVSVRVLLKERPGAGAVPFAGVGGFKVLRSGVEFKDGSCPDSSDHAGNLSCTISCPPASMRLQLSIRSPNRDVERKSNAYMVMPATLPLEVHSCLVARNTVLEFVFKTQEVLFAEIKESSSKVYAAVVSADGKQLKPLRETAAALAELATDERNRDAILMLSRIATSFPEKAADKAVAGWKNLDQYAVGAPSIVVSAAAAKSTENIARIVTTDPAQLNQSLGIIEQRLRSKPNLTGDDKALYKTLKTMREF
jgi:hypothetical protein